MKIKDVRTTELTVSILIISIIVVITSILNNIIFLAIIGTIMSCQAGWGHKLLKNLDSENYIAGTKTMEHFKIIPSIILMFIAIYFSIVAVGESSFLLGLLSLIPSFLCGYNVRISYEKEE